MSSGAPRAVTVAAGVLALGARVTMVAAEGSATVARGVLRVPVIGPLGRRGIDRLARDGEQVLTDVLPVLVEQGKQLVALVVTAIVAELDLTTLVREHADLNAIAADLDIEAILDRVDLDAVIAERVDLDAAVGHVDLDGVAKNIDIDSIAARINIEAILDRVDLIGLAEEIIEGVDLPDLIRDASTSVTADVMTDVRSTSERADDAVANAIGRLLRRKAVEGTDD